MKVAGSSILIEALFDFGYESEMLLFQVPQALIELLDQAMDPKRRSGEKYKDDHDHGVHRWALLYGAPPRKTALQSSITEYDDKRLITAPFARMIVQPSLQAIDPDQGAANYRTCFSTFIRSTDC
jgi:hypothetical protein